MLVKVNALQCDHPEHRQSPAARVAGLGARTGLVELRRRAQSHHGWGRYVTATRHEYDLCDEHRRQIPGVDFPNWKANGRG